MYWVYVIKSRKDEKLYTGCTSDIEKRLEYHNKGKVRSTRSRRPFELIYKEEFDTLALARKRENYLKTGNGRSWLKDKLSLLLNSK